MEFHLKKKDILILGGSRFIGYSMLSEFIKEDYNVTIFNRQFTVPPAPFPKGIKFVKGDRNKIDNLDLLFRKKYDALIDLSGFSPKHIENILPKYSSKIGHYIFVSTLAVMKKPFTNPIDENHDKTLLKDTYGGDKSLTENFLLNYKKKIPLTIFRPLGVFGPYDPCQAGLIFYRIINNLPILISTNSNVRTNHLFIADFIKALKLSIENSKVFGNIYNIAGDDTPSLTEFINLCGKIISITPIIKSNKSFTKYQNINYFKKKRHVSFIAEWPETDFICDNSLVKKDLNMRFTDLKESLSRTYTWMKKDTNRLNYFSMGGEKYILNDLPLPFFKKYLWKFKHLLLLLINYIRKILRY